MKTVSQLSDRVGGKVFGDGNVVIERVASLESAGEHDLSYLEDEKFFEAARQCHASCVLVPVSATVDLPCRIEVPQPKLAFALIAEILHPPKRRAPEIHPSAVVAEDAKIGR